MHKERISSYPRWVQDVIFSTTPLKAQVRDHEVLQRMFDATITDAQHRLTLKGYWTLIEKFPHFMALNLLKTTYGLDRGINSARSWLAKNLRIEQKHADMWMAWLEAFGISRSETFESVPPSQMTALADWCWHISHAGDLATAMAATNFAIEGVTGEWCPRLFASSKYWEQLPESKRESGMTWVKAHAGYDDEHPWEAMDIIVQLVGPDPPPIRIREIHNAVAKSYQLHVSAFDSVLSASE